MATAPSACVRDERTNELVTRKHANVRVWRTAAVVVVRSTKIEVLTTFISMIARSDQTADFCLDQDRTELITEVLNDAALTYREGALLCFRRTGRAFRSGRDASSSRF